MANVPIRVQASLLQTASTWKKLVWWYTSSGTPYDPSELANAIMRSSGGLTMPPGVSPAVARNWANRVQAAYDAAQELANGGGPLSLSGRLHSPHLGTGEPYMVRVRVTVSAVRGTGEGTYTLSLPFRDNPTAEDVRQEVAARMADVLPRMSEYDERLGFSRGRLENIEYLSWERR